MKENKNSSRISPLEMVTKIIKSSPLLLFLKNMVKWLETIAPNRDIDSEKINFL